MTVGPEFTQDPQQLDEAAAVAEQSALVSVVVSLAA